MKNHNRTSQINSLAKLVKTLVVATTLSMVLVACKNDKVDNSQQINAYTQSCVNCEGIGITGFPFFTAQTQAYRQSGYSYAAAMAINWSFSGQNISNQAQPQNYNQYASAAMNYVGKVSAAGQINVATALNLGFCPQIPAGTYNLTTQKVGQWAQGQISNIKFLISGAVTMTATLSQAQAVEYSYGLQYSANTNSRMSGYFTIEQVNGYYCQGAQFYLY